MKNILFAFLVSAGVTMALGPVLIPMLHRLKFGQSERSDGPQSHLKKAGTPTMGGIMIIAGILIGTLAFTLKATELVPRRCWSRSASRSSVFSMISSRSNTGTPSAFARIRRSSRSSPSP